MLYKTRIAPTPSGFLHQGNLFAFALTWLMARKEGMRIMLRVDDLDRARYRPEYLEDLFRSLESLGIDYDEGPQSIDDFEKKWSQSHRRDLYQESLQRLKELEALFSCSCSRKDVIERTGSMAYDGYCFGKNLSYGDRTKLALRWPIREGSARLKTWQQDPQWHVLSTALAYPVLYSKEGHVAYQLSSLVDDQHYGITHICRGEDLLDSSICQFLLAEKLSFDGFLNIRFHHHHLLRDGRAKLSKSNSAPAAEIYRYPQAKKEVFKLVAQYLQLKSSDSLDEMLQEYKISP